VIVTAYEDVAEGLMAEEADGAGQFLSVTLRPVVTIAAESDEAMAYDLHQRAHKMCFIARSVNFPVRHEPRIMREGASAP
jgi:organic hydroperoxide reductase OsmC/OhrA